MTASSAGSPHSRSPRCGSNVAAPGWEANPNFVSGPARRHAVAMSRPGASDAPDRRACPSSPAPGRCAGREARAPRRRRPGPPGQPGARLNRRSFTAPQRKTNARCHQAPAGPGRPPTGVHLPPPSRKGTPVATRPGRPRPATNRRSFTAPQPKTNASCQRGGRSGGRRGAAPAGADDQVQATEAEGGTGQGGEAGGGVGARAGQAGGAGGRSRSRSGTSGRSRSRSGTSGVAGAPRRGRARRAGRVGGPGGGSRRRPGGVGGGSRRRTSGVAGGGRRGGGELRQVALGGGGDGVRRAGGLLGVARLGRGAEGVEVVLEREVGVLVVGPDRVLDLRPHRFHAVGDPGRLRLVLTGGGRGVGGDVLHRVQPVGHLAGRRGVAAGGGGAGPAARNNDDRRHQRRQPQDDGTATYEARTPHGDTSPTRRLRRAPEEAM